MVNLATRMEDFMDYCSHCGLETKCKVREFSDKGRDALLSWKEAEPEVFKQPMCSECYSDLRGILADRADEI